MISLLPKGKAKGEQITAYCCLRVVCTCRTFKEGIVPFKPTAYGLHNLLRRNDLLVSRAKVSN